MDVSSKAAHYLYVTNIKNKHEHIENKYILSVDGWTAAWGRVPWILCSNSVLVKHKATSVQWFYSEMKEGEHYIEIPENFEINKFKEWALVNDDKAKKIAENASELYFELFSRQNIEDTVFTTVNDYFDAYKAGLNSAHLGMFNMIS